MSSTPRMRIGEDDFKNFLLESDLFVDKSLLIKEFLEDSAKVVLVTRPRRWGKSLNMDMPRRFLAIEVDAQGAPSPKQRASTTSPLLGGR